MKLKLLVLSHVSDYIGGAEKSLIDVVDKWIELDPDLHLEFILRKPLSGLEKQLDARGIKYYSVDYTYWSDGNLPNTPDRVFGNAQRNMRAVREIESIIQDSSPNIVLTNSMIAPWAALAAHFQSVPHVWMVREYGSKDHGRDFEIGEKETFEDIGNLSELVLANSLTLRDYVSQYIDSSKLATIYTPFSIESLQEKASRSTQSPYKRESSLKILLTGNIAPGKGQKLLIESLGYMKAQGVDSEVCFVGREGSADYMDELKRLSESLGVKEQIRYMGFQDNPLAITKHADVAVMASRMEAFGRVTFEYSAVGLPVVGSNSGATPEIVVDNKTGMLYQPDNAKDLADKLMAYAKDRKLIDIHGQAALEHVNSMMQSEYSAAAAYEMIKKIAGTQKTKFGVLNYSRRWMQYPEDARRYLEYANKAALKDLVVYRAKTLLRPYYKNFKDMQSRIRRK